MDIDGDGQISVEEYRGLAKSQAAADASMWIFKWLDKLEGVGDRNGVLSRDEWIKGMLEFGEDDDDDQWMSEMDGYKQTLQGACKAAPPAKMAPPVRGDDDPLDRRALLEEVFKAMDADSNGNVDLNEFLQQAKSREEADQLPMIMAFMDDNGDDVLSWDEWAGGMMTMFSRYVA